MDLPRPDAADLPSETAHELFAGQDNVVGIGRTSRDFDRFAICAPRRHGPGDPVR